MTRRLESTSKAPISPGVLKEIKLHFQRKIKQLQSSHEIPDDLILNFDHAFVVPITPCTKKVPQVLLSLVTTRRKKSHVLLPLLIKPSVHSESSVNLRCI